MASFWAYGNYPVIPYGCETSGVMRGVEAATPEQALAKVQAEDKGLKPGRYGLPRWHTIKSLSGETLFPAPVPGFDDDMPF